MKYYIEIPGKPLSKQSTKFTCRGGKPRTYTPKKVKQILEKIQLSAISQLPNNLNPLDGYLKIKVIYHFKQPKSRPANERRFIEKGGHILRKVKPDITDNLNKGLIDALEGIVIKTDSRIAIIEAIKLESQYNLTRIMIEKIEEKYYTDEKIRNFLDI
jgi:Holliday junction resolvase RusA-like endonuclease